MGRFSLDFWGGVGWYGVEGTSNAIARLLTRERQEGSQRCDSRDTLKMEEGPTQGGTAQGPHFPGAGKGKDGSVPRSLQRTQLCQHRELSPERPRQTPHLQNWKVTHVSCL